MLLNKDVLDRLLTGKPVKNSDDCAGWTFNLENQVMINPGQEPVVRAN